MSDSKTKIDVHLISENAGWSFSGDISKNFDSHAEKSVPLYHQGHKLVLQISDFFVLKNALIYDIGCSTGKLTAAMANRHQNNARVIGIDSEKDMIKTAQRNTMNLPNADVCLADICVHELQACDYIVCYYTIQFIQPKYRQKVFDKLYDSLNWGGALLLFEKTRGPDARFQDINSQLYQEYKLSQGFTEEEIIGKSRSLKGVLEPFSSQANYDFLKRAGFNDIMPIMKYLSFEGVLAIK